MSLKERTVNIDIMSKGYTKIKYKQGDSNQILNFKFFKNRVELDLTGYVAGIFYEKPNNEVLEKEAIINKNIVTTTITSGVLNTKGIVKAEIFLTKDTEVAISFTVLIDVEKAIDTSSALEEKEEWDVIRDLLIYGNIIDDSLTATNRTWSSNKISSQIKGKVDYKEIGESEFDTPDSYIVEDVMIFSKDDTLLRNKKWNASIKDFKYSNTRNSTPILRVQPSQKYSFLINNNVNNDKLPYCFQLNKDLNVINGNDWIKSVTTLSDCVYMIVDCDFANKIQIKKEGK